MHWLVFREFQRKRQNLQFVSSAFLSVLCGLFLKKINFIWIIYNPFGNSWLLCNIYI